MDVAKEAGFSDRDQIILREAITVLKVHAVSDITTLDGTQISQVSPTVSSRIGPLYIVSPAPSPGEEHILASCKKNMHRLTVGTKRLIFKLEDFDPTVQKSQKYLFHIDPTSDRLIDNQGRTRVEHQLGRARRTVQRFGYPDLPANANYRHLNPADVHLGDKWLMVGNVIKDQPPLHQDRNAFPHPATEEYGAKQSGRPRIR